MVFLIPMPKELKLHNAYNEKCDMLIGPCACGSWHYGKDVEKIVKAHFSNKKAKKIIKFIGEYIIKEKAKQVLREIEKQAELEPIKNNGLRKW